MLRTSTVLSLLPSHIDNQAIVHSSEFNESLPQGTLHDMIITHTRSSTNIFHILESQGVLVKLALHPELFPSVVFLPSISSDSSLRSRLLFLQVGLVDFAEHIDPRSLRPLSPPRPREPLASVGRAEPLLRSLACGELWSLLSRLFFARGTPRGRGCSSERSSEWTCCVQQPSITRT